MTYLYIYIFCTLHTYHLQKSDCFSKHVLKNFLCIIDGFSVKRESLRPPIWLLVVLQNNYLPIYRLVLSQF